MPYAAAIAGVPSRLRHRRFQKACRSRTSGEATLYVGFPSSPPLPYAADIAGVPYRPRHRRLLKAYRSPISGEACSGRTPPRCCERVAQFMIEFVIFRLLFS